MLPTRYLAMRLLAMASVSFAIQIPFDHIMWGENGAGGDHLIKRTTTAKVAAASSSTATILSGSVAPASSSSAAPTTPSAASAVSPSASASRAADSTCTNSPLTRSCWYSGFSIATDFDAKWPNTGKTVSYNLELTNTTCNPDGNGDRICLLFNNQYPGPLIRASKSCPMKTLRILVALTGMQVGVI